MSKGVVADVNPLSPGNNANSVESAARDFDRLFGDLEPDYRDDSGNPIDTPDAPRPRRSERRPSPDRIMSGDDRDAPDPDRARDGQSRDDGEGDLDADDILKDPILGDAPPKKPGDDDTETEDDEDEGDKTGTEDDEDDDDGAQGDLDLDQEVEVQVAGDKVKVKLSEALAGYSREADYRQKSTVLADERREVEDYARETVAERQKYQTAIEDFLIATKAMEPDVSEWDALKRENPQLFIQMQDQWKVINGKREQAKGQLAEITQRNEADEARKYASYVREQNRLLEDQIPALKNEKKADEFRKKIFKYGKAAGYSAEELASGAVDARDVMTLYKAARYDEIQASRKSGQRPGARKAPSPKPSLAQTPRVVSTSRTSSRVDQSRNLRAADAKLQRSGSVKDAAMAFTELLRR